MTPNIKPQIVAPTSTGTPAASAGISTQIRPQMIDALGRRGRWTGRRIAVALVLIVAAGAAAALIILRGAGAADRSYQTDAVTRTDLVMRVSAPGSLDVDNAVPVPAPLPGVVASVLVDEDQTVVAGQLLATLEPGGLDADASRAAAEARQAEAQLAEATATADAAVGELTRAESLRGANLVSDEQLAHLDSEVKRARASAAGARAAVEGTRAGARGARQRANRAEVRAPSAGVILRRDAAVGAAVRPESAPLFVIAPRLDTLRLVADIDEADVGSVKTDATATFTVPAWPGRTFEARLVRVRTAPTRGTAGISYGAILEAANPDRALRPGMTAAVSFVVAIRPQTLTVPEAALRWSPDGASGGRQRVYRVEAGAAHPVPVKVGVSDGTRTEVEGDLRAGEAVVVGTVGKTPVPGGGL